MEETVQRLVFSGINGSTGEYLFQQLPAEAIARAALGENIDLSHYRNLKRLIQAHAAGHLGVMEHIDADALDQAGWGVILPFDSDPRIIGALRPLLEHRRAEAGRLRPGRYREFTGPDAYRPGDSSDAWLARQGVAPGPVSPDRGVPYYLLIVGGPDQIPYRFQYHLDVQHAVGRITFATPDEYRRYAESVVRAETSRLAHPRQVGLAGVTNGDDPATRLSTDDLLRPLAKSLAEDDRFTDWAIDLAVSPEATSKAGMARLIGGPRTPREDDFSHHALLRERPMIAPHPFVAGLPQALLGHPAGGALAVIGHIDRAWSWSFRWRQVQSSVNVFADAIKRLMRGQRVGLAMEKFNERYGQIAASLNSELENIRFGKIYDPHDLADLWTANNDARAYVIVGDPAVRLVFTPPPPAG